MPGGLRQICSGLLLFYSLQALGSSWAFISDIEGSLNYWNSFVSQSDALENEADVLRLKEGWQLAIVGDFLGRGGHNFELLETLERLRSDSNGRVHLIAGNRDLLILDLWRFFLLYKTADLVSDLKIYNELLAAVRTGGFQRDLEKRFGPLEQLQHHERIQLVDILQEFIAPGGMLTRFLHGLEHWLEVDRGRVLLVHGAITAENFNVHPQYGWRYSSHSQQYIEVNDWFKEKVQKATSGDITALDFLHQYVRQHPQTPKRNDSSFLYGRYTSSLGQHRSLDGHISHYLARSGRRLLISGHTPTRLPIFSYNGEVGVLVIDNSRREDARAPAIHLRNGTLSSYNRVSEFQADVGIEWNIAGAPLVGHTTETGTLVTGLSLGRAVHYWAHRVPEQKRSHYDHYRLGERIIRSCQSQSASLAAVSGL